MFNVLYSLIQMVSVCFELAAQFGVYIFLIIIAEICTTTGVKRNEGWILTVERMAVAVSSLPTTGR
jgi:hypothetical protein